MANRLNAGCGKTILEGWINLDIFPGTGVDAVVDLEDRAGPPIRFIEYFDEILLSHVFEHFKDPLSAMYNLWLMAKPGCLMTVRCPWGGNWIAFEDPTHVRQVFLQTMHYFSQTAYGAADYGYRGDWRTKRQIVTIDDKMIPPHADLELIDATVKTCWNVGVEIISELECVRPARAPGQADKGYQLEYALLSQIEKK